MQRNFPIFFENMSDDTLRWEKLFYYEIIHVIAEEVLVNRFEIVTIRVLSNHHLFTKRTFWSSWTKPIFLRTESRQIPLEINDTVGSRNDTHN